MHPHLKLKLSEKYDPRLGIGCIGPRTSVLHPSGCHVSIPDDMLLDSDYSAVSRDPVGFDRLRVIYDFEFWAVTCCNIRDKLTGKVIGFTLNPPQRLVAGLFEEDRRLGRPIRFIMLKARQWGCSTLVQMYMAWIQCTQRRNWNSLICAHVKDTSAIIRGMYSDMLAAYPRDMWMGDEGSVPMFKPFERSQNVREIPGRGCRVTVGSSENHEAVRGADYAMAHLSEVAFWASTPTRSPEQFIRAVCGSVNIGPLTLVVMESTANGVGNYFHSEWLRAEAGTGDKRPVFIPWYYIPHYSTPLDCDEALFMSRLDEYEMSLITKYDCTPAQVNWYRLKRREYPDHSQMKAEYPTNPLEAFTNTGYAVFDNAVVEKLREACCPPVMRGEMTGPVVIGPPSVTGMRFGKTANGPLAVWTPPDPAAVKLASRYMVVVDVGGRSRTSDYSVIAVFDRMSVPGALEVVAQWRGHCDHDILAWKAVAIARWYGNAHLVYESNTLETDNTEGDPSLFILNEIAWHYDNLYYRPSTDLIGAPDRRRPGFHTNRSTKTAAVTCLNAAMRDGRLIERDNEACNEYNTFQYFTNGSLGALAGHHDDIIITRAIAMSVLPSLPDPMSYPDALSFLKGSAGKRRVVTDCVDDVAEFLP